MKICGKNFHITQGKLSFKHLLLKYDYLGCIYLTGFTKRYLPKLGQLLRSRGTRERILIWFAGARNRDFLDCKLAAPVGFLQGLWASFLCPSVMSCLLSFVASFVVFDFLGVSLKLTGF